MKMGCIKLSEIANSQLISNDWLRAILQMIQDVLLCNLISKIQPRSQGLPSYRPPSRYQKDKKPWKRGCIKLAWKEIK